jgi:hypothetical protein
MLPAPFEPLSLSAAATIFAADDQSAVAVGYVKVAPDVIVVVDPEIVGQLVVFPVIDTEAYEPAAVTSVPKVEIDGVVVNSAMNRGVAIVDVAPFIPFKKR